MRYRDICRRRCSILVSFLELGLSPNRSKHRRMTCKLGSANAAPSLAQLAPPLYESIPVFLSSMLQASLVVNEPGQPKKKGIYFCIGNIRFHLFLLLQVLFLRFFKLSVRRLRSALHTKAHKLKAVNRESVMCECWEPRPYGATQLRHCKIRCSSPCRWFMKLLCRPTTSFGTRHHWMLSANKHLHHRKLCQPKSCCQSPCLKGFL